jgi:hypothetical protein
MEAARAEVQAALARRASAVQSDSAVKIE